MKVAALTLLCFVPFWLVAGVLEALTVVEHRREYGTYPGMWQAAIYWFGTSAGVVLFTAIVFATGAA